MQAAGSLVTGRAAPAPLEATSPSCRPSDSASRKANSNGAALPERSQAGELLRSRTATTPRGSLSGQGSGLEEASGAHRSGRSRCRMSLKCVLEAAGALTTWRRLETAPVPAQLRRIHGLSHVVCNFFPLFLSALAPLLIYIWEATVTEEGENHRITLPNSKEGVIKGRRGSVNPLWSYVSCSLGASIGHKYAPPVQVAPQNCPITVTVVKPSIILRLSPTDLSSFV